MKAVVVVVSVLVWSTVNAQGDFAVPDLFPFQKDFKDLFDVVCKKAEEANPCDDAPFLDRGRLSGVCAVTDQTQRFGYYYSKDQGACLRYVFGGCTPGGNHFESAAECRAVCIPICKQPAPSANSGGNCAAPRVVWYYDELTSSCESKAWDGCLRTGNIFDSRQECMQACNGVVEITSNVARTPAPPQTMDIAQFCNTFRPTKAPPVTSPRTESIQRPNPVEEATEEVTIKPAAVTEEISEPESPTIELEASGFETTAETVTTAEEVATISPAATEPATTLDVENETLAPAAARTAAALPTGTVGTRSSSTCDLLSCARQSTKVRSKLRFVSVFARQDCIEVIVRIRCRKGLTRRPTDGELTRLCGLVSSGIQRYWTRPSGISVNCPNAQQVPVRVRVQTVSHWLGPNTKDVVIKMYDGEPLLGNTRSHNSDILAMTMKYDRSLQSTFYDEQFEKTAGHEIGHSILRAARGYSYSWTHKGTSTWYGKLLNTNTPPATGEVDLMKYYDEPYPSDTTVRTIATEEDVKYLVAEAKRSYCTNDECSGADLFPLGHPCLRDGECSSGKCSIFRCVECTKNAHCKAGTYCANRLLIWKPNVCKAAKAHGSLCSSDRQCSSGHCHGGRCGECETHRHCPEGQYCSGKNLPLLKANRCQASKGQGAFCVHDRECSSGHCHGARCGECEVDQHCQSDEYCSGRNVPLVRANRCESRKVHGAFCTRDRECSNRRCHGGRCGECETDSHCASDEYCSGTNVPLVQANRCMSRKGHGAFCTRNRHCSNNRCHGGRCGECENDEHCAAGQYCSGTKLPLLKANRCVSAQGHGGLCTRDEQCLNTRCHGGRCGECETDSHCTSDKYCSGTNVPLVQANRCVSRKGHGAFCTRNRHCSNNRCHGGRCGECETDNHCPSNKYCSGKNLPLIQANRCVTSKEHGALCTRERHCLTGRCHGGRCGECETDAHCPSNEYCSGKNLLLLQANRCDSRRRNGALCTRDRQCSSGHCFGARCGECETDAHCSGNKYCSGIALINSKSCENRKSLGSFCTRDGQCVSRHCKLARCSECENDSHCPSHKYCATNSCKTRKCSGFCTRDRQCKSSNCRWYLSCKRC